VTDRKANNPTPDDAQDEQLEQPAELSLEEHLQGILDQIEVAEPGLLDADQLIGDDGKPRFVPKPKPAPAQAAKPVAAAPPSVGEPIEEDELAALINQAIDQASKPNAPATDAPTPAQMPQASDEELSRAVDRDIDQAVQQAAMAKPVAAKPTKPVEAPKRAEFDPASNFVPIEPDQLADAIEEAFTNPIPHNPNAPVAQPVEQAAASTQQPAQRVEVPKRAEFDPASNFVPIEPDQLADAIEEAFSNPIPHNPDAPVAQPVAEQPAEHPPAQAKTANPQTSQRIEAPKLAEFDPASNFVPIEPDALADAIEEAFSHPIPHNPDAPEPEDVIEVQPDYQAASPPPADDVVDPLAGVADDAKMSNDDLDALFEAIGQVAPTSETTAPAPQPPAKAPADTATDPLANFADDAKMSNDDLDALFDAVQTVTDPQPSVQPSAPAQPAQANVTAFQQADDFDRMSNDDLDALFADPDSLLAEHAKEQQDNQPSPEAAFSENDFNLAWDSVLTQAQDQLAKIAEDKLARQKERDARRLENLRQKAKDDPNLTQLLEDAQASVFDDQDFAQQWDQVLSEARTQLNQMVGGAGKAASSIDDGGKLSNDDLTDQLDNLLAQVQADAESSDAFESLDENQLSDALDSVLNQAKAELARITEEKLKRHQEDHAQKIQTIRESLSNDELATELDDLIHKAIEAHDAAEHDQDAEDQSFNMDDFNLAWDDVLDQAKIELNRLAIEKKQRKEAIAKTIEHNQQQQAAASPQTPQTPPAPEAPSQQNASIDLASELDALFADAIESPKPAADSNTGSPSGSGSETLSNDELANELENLMNQAMQGAVNQASEPSASETVSADEIQELIDSGVSQTQTPQSKSKASAAAIPHDPAMDEPQDPSAMINHIDSLLAEHASEAVSDMFETPEKIAEHGLSEDDLEAAFQSPEQVLQNLQEASQNTTQAKQVQAEAKPAQAKPAQPAKQPAQQATTTDASDEDLEGYFETPDDLNEPAQAANFVSDLVEEAVEVADEDADALMGDFESPDQTQPDNVHVAVEMAYEAAEDIEPEYAQPIEQAVAAQTDDDEIEEASEFVEPAEKKPSFISRLMAKLKPLGKLSGTLSVLLANLLKQLGPLLNRICAIINGPLLRLNKGTRDIVGYVGLVQLFFGVILFFVYFKQILFGS
jgi:hypothetical protein